MCVNYAVMLHYQLWVGSAVRSEAVQTNVQVERAKRRSVFQ